MGSDRPSTKERIVESASRLFNQRGFTAVGVDDIALEADVAKMTLYRHFASKDDLIVEHLRVSADDFWEWFDGSMSHATDPREKIYALFDALEDRCRSALCAGCPFQAAAIEFPDRNHPVHRLVREHKQTLRDRLETLVRDTGVRHSGAVANQLILLMEGALASVRYLSLPVPAREAADAVRTLLA